MKKEVFEVIRQNTLVNTPRLNKLEELILQCANLDGNIAEVGVYKGGTGYLFASTETVKTIYLFDTFEGLPEPNKDKLDLHRKGEFKSSLEHAQNLFKPFKNVLIYKGLFPQDTGHIINQEKFCLVHIDVDLYPCVKDCLEFFFPKMVNGGILVLDDYNASTCPGAKLATDEFCLANNCIVIPTVECQAIIRK